MTSTPTTSASITLEDINRLPLEQALSALDGIYEHSPWMIEAGLQSRPFSSLAALQTALVEALETRGEAAKLDLIRAHPELAGKAMQDDQLTQESNTEQQRAGLKACTLDELEQLQSLNQAYRDKHGFPFILAVRGPRGSGLSKDEVIATMQRRLHNSTAFELQEAVRNIHRIAEMRLEEKLQRPPERGNRVWDWCEQLSQYSEPEYQAQGQLCVTYLSQAHLDCANYIAEQMQLCGCDSVEIDPMGNVVGRYWAQGWEQGQAPSSAPILLTGSHYDTVRNGGKYDGRLGIFVPLECLRQLHQAQQRLPFSLEIVAFAEEEGQRYPATFLGSGALLGEFEPQLLQQIDAKGVPLEEAFYAAGKTPPSAQNIAAIARKPENYLGFVEIHIEQGPVLNQLQQPLGVVSAINGARRFTLQINGVASHAGTTPMWQRQDAACAAAQWLLYVEARARQSADAVATVGMLQVPNGSVNIIPGRCEATLDVRAPKDSERDTLCDDLLAELQRICTERDVQCHWQENLRIGAAPSAPFWQKLWHQGVASLGLQPVVLPSGAGHDAMKLHQIMPQAMLFVRGQNSGISHNPLESTTNSDIQWAVLAFENLLQQLAASDVLSSKQTKQTP